MDSEVAIKFATRLLSAERNETFGAALVDMLRELSDFDYFAVVGYIGEDRPILIHDNLREVASETVVKNFLEGGYLLDAVYVACSASVEPGLYRLVDLAPDEYYGADFAGTAHYHPCVSPKSGSLAEEIVFILRITDGIHVVISMMRALGRDVFSQEEVSDLGTFTPLLNELAARHWRSLLSPSRRPTAQTSRRGIVLEDAFRNFQKETLSEREQSVVRLLLRGHSTASAAQVLGITEGTLKVHRKNVYEKLNINSLGQLFRIFCDQVLTRPD
ncbi:MAG: helix-turn-helix transcriptional regulator [Rhizobiaceae bacterium]